MEKTFWIFITFFKDERYIRIDGKPLVILYAPLDVKESPPMMDYWQKLAQENGLSGICFANQENMYNHELTRKWKKIWLWNRISNE